MAQTCFEIKKKRLDISILLGTHPFPKERKKIELTDLPVSTGFQGWVNDGCVEHKNEDGTFVGMNGAQKYLANA